MNLPQLITEVSAALPDTWENGLYIDGALSLLAAAEDMISNDSRIAVYSLSEVMVALWFILNAQQMAEQQPLCHLLDSLNATLVRCATEKGSPPTVQAGRVNKACTCAGVLSLRFKNWYVLKRNCNLSRLDSRGYRFEYSPDAMSSVVRCAKCGAVWAMNTGRVDKLRLPPLTHAKHSKPGGVL